MILMMAAVQVDNMEVVMMAAVQVDNMEVVMMAAVQDDGAGEYEGYKKHHSTVLCQTEATHLGHDTAGRRVKLVDLRIQDGPHHVVVAAGGLAAEGGPIWVHPSCLPSHAVPLLLPGRQRAVALGIQPFALSGGGWVLVRRENHVLCSQHSSVALGARGTKSEARRACSIGQLLEAAAD